MKNIEMKKISLKNILKKTFKKKTKKIAKKIAKKNISKTKKVALAIQKNQIAIKPIFPPTVPLSDVGIRICLHSYNTMKEIDLLYCLLSSV